MVIGGIALGIILLCILIPWASYKIASNILGFNPSASQQSGISLPGVTSLSIEDAKKKLDDLGIKYDIEEVYSDSVEEGKVISQKPEEGSNYDKEKNSPVKLTVSKGIKVVKMPKVVGMDIETATAELKKYELEVKEEKEESVTVEENYVIRQEVDEGKEIPAGTEVTLYVSKGPKKITVESVEDLDVEEAKKKLTEAGLEVNVITTEDTSKTNGVVLKQNLEPGTVVSEGTKITLTVNKIQELKEATINVHVKSITGYKEPESSEKDDENKKTPKNVTVRINVDDEDVYKQSVPENTEIITKTIKAKGVANVRVYIDEVRYANEQIDMNGNNTVLDVK